MAFPQKFGRYWLHEKIGHGGMAEVFRASIGPDPFTYAFDCVVKRLHRHLSNQPRFTEMFAVEQYLAQRLKHPNLLETYEASKVEGCPYVAMELNRGTDLGQLLSALRSRQLRIPKDLALHIAMEVLRGLDYVHRASDQDSQPLGVVHGDITPSNVFLTNRGDVKIGDFGIARLPGMESPRSRQLLSGKAAYMPPEVLAGVQCSQTDDLWATSVCLLEMVCNQRAFGSTPPDEIARRAAPPKLADDAFFGDKKLMRLLSAILNGNPRKRPKSAAELYKTVRQYMRDEGYGVDRDTLARFVLATTGDVATMSAGLAASIRDGITGAYNYRHFLEHLEAEIDRCRRYQRGFSLLFVDIDDFARHRSRVGRTGGEALLRCLGELLSGETGLLRASDFVARHGADKFCVILPETPAKDGRDAGTRLRESIYVYPWSTVHERLDRVTVSVGVASFPLHGTTVGALVQAAEVASYYAKRQGKNQVVVADEEFNRIKEKIGSGEANEGEVARWCELQREYEKARRRWSHRKHRRVSTSLIVQFVTGEQLIEAYSEDLGTGGLRLVVSSDFEVGTEIELQVQLPGETEAFIIPSLVVWSRRSDRTVGFEFLELPAHIRQRFEDLVCATIEVTED